MRLHQIFFALLLVFVPTQLGFHFWPEWSLVLGRRVDYLAPTLFFTDTLIISMIIAWCLSESRGQNVAFRIKRKTLLLFVLLTVFAFINIYRALSWQVALYGWLKLAEYFLLGFYIVKTKPRLSTVFSFLSVGVLFSGLLAIGQFLLQRSLGGLLWWFGERTFTVETPGIARIALGGHEYLRAYGTLPHPNVLGGFLATTVPLLIHQLIVSHKKERSLYIKIFLSATVFVGVIALVLTFSRSAWIAAVFATVLVITKTQKSHPRISYLAFLVACVVPLIFWLVPFSLTEESVVVRQQLNRAAVSVWKSAPLFGVGASNFLIQLPEFVPTRTIYFLQPVHNMYLLVLSEIGVVGYIGIFFLIWMGRGFWQKAKMTPYFVAVVGLLIIGLVDHYPLTLQQGQLLCTILLSFMLL